MELNLSGLGFPVRIQPPRPLSEDELLTFSANNRLYPVETDEKGDLIVMSPSGSKTSAKNFWMNAEFAKWLEQTGGGTPLESEGGVTLPDGSVRAADLAWIAEAKWNALTPQQQERYAPVTPDFVVELRSPTDRLDMVTEKMEMWMRNGVELAWLIDPIDRVVTIYRPNREPERLENISQVQGEGPVAGFVLPLDRIFTA
ncbi:Uma2 family endonuclease [Terriglobus sp.]|uniref:Uma2 family endonuclease n=1 Tax=Terriglobus sp. TaxID=1889013 RepID=UPI003B002BDF